MTFYMVTNGVAFLSLESKHVYSLSTECNAAMWHTREQAMIALVTGIEKGARDEFFIQEINLVGKKVNIKVLINADTRNYEQWCQEIGGLKKLTDSIDSVKRELLKELDNVEMEICDINHYIEFNKLNAAQGWAAYEMMRTSRLQRRKIKDLLYIINVIQKNKGRVSNSEAAKKAISALKKREYRPRKLDFLFEKK